MTTITQSITALPDGPDPAADDPDTFSTKAAARVLAEETMVTEINTWAGQANTVSGEVNANAVIAAAAVNQLQAASFAFRYVFASSTTMGDPGAGTMRLNHATVASATAIAFDSVSSDSGNPDVSDFIATWGASTNTIKGQIILRKVGAPATFATFNITAAVTDNTGWLQATVAYVAGNGALSAADEIMCQFARTGDKGADGGAGSYFPTVKKTSAHNAAAGEIIPADTSGGIFTITLPASPADGSAGITAWDAGGAWATNNLTVARNGSTIDGLAEDFTCEISGGVVTFAPCGTNAWRTY